MKKKSGMMIFSAIMLLFFFVSFAEAQLVREGNILWTGKYICLLLMLSLPCGLVTGAGLTWLLAGIKEKTPCAERLGARRAGLCSWGLLVIAYLPAYLAYYPGICSYDITIQLEQITSGNYNDHHPLAHTLLVEGFLRLGELLGNTNTGMGLYTLVQLLCITGALAVGIALLYKRGMALWKIVLVQLLDMCLPVYWYMAVSATKDVIFTAFVLLFMYSFYQLLWRAEDKWHIGGWDVIYALSLVGLILFRNNGKYAYLVVLIIGAAVCVLARRKKRLFCRLWLLGLAGLLAGNVLLGGLFRVTGAIQGDKREMLSIPIQQLARTYIYHGELGDGTLEEEARELLDAFFPQEVYKNYRPDIADPVKKYTLTSVALQRAGEWISTYVGLFFRYPGDYLNAALAVDAGFLYPFDVTHGDINFNGRDKGLGYIQTRWVENELNPKGIYKESKWESLHQGLEEFADTNAYQRIPLLKYLMQPGFYLWLYLLLAGYLLWRKRYRMLLPLAFVLGYYITLLLGPTVQLRYMYPVMLLLPYALFFSEGGDAGDRR